MLSQQHIFTNLQVICTETAHASLLPGHALKNREEETFALDLNWCSLREIRLNFVKALKLNEGSKFRLTVEDLNLVFIKLDRGMHSWNTDVWNANVVCNPTTNIVNHSDWKVDDMDSFW